MREAESYFLSYLLKRHTAKISPQICVNFGCGDVIKIKERSPHIEENVFSFLESRGCRVIHSDFQKYSGVEVVCDLTNLKSLQFVETLPAPRIIVLSNVLEHIPKVCLKKVVSNLRATMSKGDHLIVTVPYRYPYHPDPIDNLFRPSSEELSEIFGNGFDWLERKEIDIGSFKDEFSEMSLKKRLGRFLRLFWPLQKPKRYFSNMHRLTFLYRKYSSSVIYGIKN
jgi:hypothetical protein